VTGLRYDVVAALHSELSGETADTAAGARDEDAALRGQRTRGEHRQGLMRGLDVERQRCGGCEAQLVGKRHQPAGVGCDEFGIAARRASGQVPRNHACHPVAHLEPNGVGAD